MIGILYSIGKKKCTNGECVFVRNIFIDRLCNNCKAMNYNIVTMDGIGESPFVIPFKIINNVVYSVFIIDIRGEKTCSRENFDNAVRAFKHAVLKDEVHSINILQLIYSDSREKYNELASYMATSWFVDAVDSRLIIYENENDEFLNARKIIEDTLEGISYDNSGFLVEKSRIRIPYITISLIVINFIVFIAMEIAGSTESVDYMLKYGALSYDKVMIHKEYYRLFTSFFMHFGFEHIVNNMLVLGVTGYYLENILKKHTFIILYMTAGLFSGAVSMFYYHIMEEYTVSAGASGAIYGLIGGMIFLIVTDRRLFRAIGIPRMIIFFVLIFYNGYRNSTVDVVAHVAGFVFGFIIMCFIRKKIKKQGDLGYGKEG